MQVEYLGGWGFCAPTTLDEIAESMGCTKADLLNPLKQAQFYLTRPVKSDKIPTMDDYIDSATAGAIETAINELWPEGHSHQAERDGTYSWEVGEDTYWSLEPFEDQENPGTLMWTVYVETGPELEQEWGPKANPVALLKMVKLVHGE